MPIFEFGRNKHAKKPESSKPEAGSKPAPKKSVKTSSPKLQPSSSVLVRPRVTEKTGNLTARNVYTFDVATSATKRTIAAAVQAEYNVKPLAIRIVNRKGDRVRLRTRRGFGTRPATKKAYVTVKKGDRIEFSS